MVLIKRWFMIALGWQASFETLKLALLMQEGFRLRYPQKLKAMKTIKMLPLLGVALFAYSTSFCQFHEYHEGYDEVLDRPLRAYELDFFQGDTLQPTAISGDQSYSVELKLSHPTAADIALVWEIPNLVSLSIRNADFSAFPPGVSSLPHLRELSVTNNQPGKRLPNLSGFNQLATLQLISVEDTSLAEGISEMAKLTQLALHLPEVKELPAAMAGLKKLNWLVVRQPLDVFPDFAEAWEQLEKLEMSFGKGFSRVPSVFSKLSQLKYVKLSFLNPRRATIETSEEGLKKLQTLILSGIDSFPDLKEPLPRVQRLNVFQDGAFVSLQGVSKLPALTNLTVRARTVGPDFAEGIEKLTHLRVFKACCGFDRIPPQLQHVQSLQAILLSGDKVDHLPDWLFEMPQLETVHLTKNATLSKLNATNYPFKLILEE